jgi:chromosome segregation ATPase
MDKDASRRLATVANYALVLKLKATVARLHEVDEELEDVVLALKDDQEEVETYTDDIADCRDRIEAVDEFVRELKAGNVPTIPDVASALEDMTEEREEEESMLKLLIGARECHEQQLQGLRAQFAALQEQRLALQKKSSQICSFFGRSGIFDVVRQQLAEQNPKML